MPPNNKLWRFFLILTKNSDYYNHNNSILLVDDENDILNLFCDCLQKFGYETIPFNNPVDALNYIYNSKISNCSLIITDYKMPLMSGIDLIKKIREKDTTFKLKIILISAFIKSNIMGNDISDSLRIDKIIEKPIHLENLIEEVQKLTTVIN
jgi:Response regulator containing CheY-like receiver, AAA-type ATPase, and DNA-binding domains